MTSHRQVFRSSAVIGGASVINMVIGIFKVKVLAVLLGPAGIGLMGLYQNIMGMASMLAGCGMESSGVRQLAASVDETETLSVVRRALWLGSLMLGGLGLTVLWLMREPVTNWVFDDSTHTTEVGLLGLGLLLAVIAGSQTALLRGLRRVDDLARVSVISALVAAIVGILAVYWLGRDGVLWFVLTAPAANVLVAGYYAARVPRPKVPYDLAAIRQQWLALLKLGIPLMAAGLIMLTTQLAARSIVLRELGLDASGYFQAAWAISMIYVGFVLNAMAMDYFPRLSAAIGDRGRTGKIVNEQAEMALLLAGPALIAMITLAPWIIQVLYAPTFSPAAEILKWQVLGDIFKVASVPIAFIFMSLGRGGVAIGIQAIWSAVYLGALLLGIGDFGLVMAGAGFCAAYLVYYIVITAIANNLIGFKSTQWNLHFTLILAATGSIIMILGSRSPIAGYVSGSLATLILAVYSLRRLNHLMDLTGWLRLKIP